MVRGGRPGPGWSANPWPGPAAASARPSRVSAARPGARAVRFRAIIVGTRMEADMTLQSKKGLIVGIANEHSIAYGCADAFHRAGAELAITYLNAKAEPYVRPLAERLQSPIIIPCDVREPGQLEAVFARITKTGAGSISCCTRSLMRPKKICTAGSPTARRPGSTSRWRCRAIPSSGWPNGRTADDSTAAAC